MLLATGTQWVVQHDDPLSRVVQETEVYTNTDTTVVVGSHVDLWIDRDTNGFGTVRSSSVTGEDALPANHIDGGAPIVGTVIRTEPSKLLVDHEPIPDVMPGMVMPFIAGLGDIAGLTPGDRITGIMTPSTYGYALADIHVIGSVDVEGAPQGDPLETGSVLPGFELAGHNGESIIIGEGQRGPTVVAFVYTTCPDPNYCPATVAKLLGVLSSLTESQQMVAVTIDPATDTVAVLADYARLVGAEAPQWTFARPEPAQLHSLAVAAGLTVSHRSGRIAHSTRLLVLDADGRLVRRFDDNNFALTDVTDAL
ncbi:MAG: protein SCO1/2 [Myxococcota bacterium]